MRDSNNLDDKGGILPHGMTREEMEGIAAYAAGIRIRGILADANMTHAQLAERFGIPLRTVDDWCRGARKPPDYVVRMIGEILQKP